MGLNSFGAESTLQVGDRNYTINRLDALAGRDIEHLPYSLKVLLENLLRNEDGVNVLPDAIEMLANFTKSGPGEGEIAFSPARVLLQDLTGIPAVVDLAAMRDAVVSLGGRASAVNPLVPVDLVIDHSVVVDVAGRPDAFAVNSEHEFQRNTERYRFLRWGQQGFSNFRLIPPDTGICHQVNLEFLSQVVFSDDANNAYPDTLVGADSHTTMANGLSVLAWGVGGIEGEAAMLGQPISMLVPPVVGLRLEGELPEGATATDMVLTLVELLRAHGVVSKFVECWGPGVANVPVENRATIGNMSPEYGSTVTIFPIDDQTLRYLRLTGRSPERVALVEAYAKEQGMWADPTIQPHFSENVTLDLSTVVPSISGPARPQDRVPLNRSKQMFSSVLRSSLPDGAPGKDGTEERPHVAAPVTLAGGESFELDHGHIVVAAITSCTNTSNPQVMLAAGLLAKNAVERGITAKPWVKTSLAPGSRVVMDYYERAGLIPYLEKLGYGLVGFGCTTCIGNSGPIAPEISAAIGENKVAAAAVLSGNRNFEGRIHADVRMNYLASPPLVVAYAIAGTMDIDLYNDPIAQVADGNDVYLRDIWPSTEDVLAAAGQSVRTEGFASGYSGVFDGDANWQSLDVPTGESYVWEDSTYVRHPPYFDGMGPVPAPVEDIVGARCLLLLGNSVTTDHISPAQEFRASSPAGKWLAERGVAPADMSSFGARRGNHEVMVRGTFANPRLHNQLASGEGNLSVHFPDGVEGSVFDTAMTYQAEGVPLIAIAGRDYGAGSSRDWAAKGPLLLGIRAAIAVAFERIHRSNLIGMGLAPLEFLEGEDANSLGLTGREVFSITGLAGSTPEELIKKRLTVTADDKTFEVTLRIDTLTEAEYFVHGGILHYVVRKLAGV
jgi:aconitate hydratase